MRSPRDHRSSRRRSPTLYQNKDRKRSASPSPPRPTAKTLKAIRITVSNVPGKPPTGTRVSSFDQALGPGDRCQDFKKFKELFLNILGKNSRCADEFFFIFISILNIFLRENEKKLKYNSFLVPQIKTFFRQTAQIIFFAKPIATLNYFGNYLTR